MNQMLHALVVFGSYLLGSIPFGYLIVKARSGGDIRTSGSGGTGATNVTRNAGKGAGLLTLLLDAAKGSAAILLARSLLLHDSSAEWWVAAAAMAAVVGHIFPVWLGFRGGKGVATALGVFLALAPIAVLVVLPVFVLVVLLTRYVSLGSIIVAALLPFATWWLHRSEATFMAAIICGALIILKHHANIRRLASGVENRLNFK